jgi:imidazolonepropionase-like amidohydrolase
MRKIIISLVYAAFAVTGFAQVKFDVLITNVSLLRMKNDKVEKNITVGIKDGKIVYAGKFIAAQKAVQFIDGTGKFLMPGLYDMHVHWPDNNAIRFFQLQTLAGITTSRIMSSEPATIDFTNNKEVIAPRLIVGFPIRSSLDMVPEKASFLVDSIKKAGYNFIKIYSIKNEILFDAIVAAAKNKGLAVCGHALANIKPEKLIASGYRSIEHVGYFDKIKSETALDSLLAITLQYGTFICPTLDWTNMVYHSYAKDSLQYRAGYAIGEKLYHTQWDTTYAATTKQLGADEKKYKDYMANDVAKKITILQKVHAKKIPIIAGSDAEEPYQTPGFSLIEELLLIQKAGLSNYDLLKTVTINPAIYFAEQNKTGTIEKGMQANVILLQKNPLDNIKNLETVVTSIINGKVFEAALLTEQLK